MRKLSLVIPVYNEEARIPKNIGEIFSFLKTFPIATEVIFVNDGSKDRTFAVLENYKKEFNFKFVGYPTNRGKGYAVRQGVFASEGEWVVFFDIDLATPISELSKLPPFFESDEKIIIGNRNLYQSVIKRKESRVRVFLGEGFLWQKSTDGHSIRKFYFWRGFIVTQSNKFRFLGSMTMILG